MRTLKIFVIAALLFLFSMPAVAANYPPEMPDIKNAPVQFTCEMPSLLFIKFHINPAEMWEVLIEGRDNQEMIIDMIIRNKRTIFAFIPSINEWKNLRNLNADEDEELAQYSGGAATEEENRAIHSCIKSNLINLRNRGLLP